jgi:type VI protein secretion system component Hcp
MHRSHRVVVQLVSLVAGMSLASASLLAGTARAAVNAFLDVPGIPGESTSPLPGLIEVLSYDFAVTPAATVKPLKVSAPCGGHVALPQANRITITKNLDKASPLLFQAAAEGTTFQTVTLHLFDATTGTESFTLTLSNTIFSSITHSAGGGVPTETLTLSSASLQTTYVKPGDPTTTSSASWVACIPPGRGGQ